MFARIEAPSVGFRIVCAALFCCSAAWSQTTLSGSVYDGNGGPLLAGAVYDVVGNVDVPVGQTLTVQPGATLRFGAYWLDVQGRLEVAGTTAEPVLFTSILGGAAAPGDWFGVQVRASGTLVMDHAILRYAGRNGFAPIYGLGGPVTLRDTTIGNAQYSGMDLKGLDTDATVARCSFEDNGGHAVTNVTIGTLPGFSDNTAHGNGLGDYVLVTNPSPASDVSLGPENGIGGVLVFSSPAVVPVGTTLTLRAGATLKWLVGSSSYFTIDGTLRLHGNPIEPVVVTTLSDDEYGGDTNGDGPGSGSPGEWLGVYVRGGKLVGRYATIRFGGRNGFAPIYAQGGRIELFRSHVQEGLYSGMDLNGMDASVAVEGCSFDDNGLYAIHRATIGTLEGFVDNSASGNAGGDQLRVTNLSPTSDLAIGPRNGLDGVLVFAGSGTIAAERTLTLEAGLVVKWAAGASAYFTTHGALNLAGTGFEPVVLTSIADDAFGGDTNGDGPSVGAPGDWLGLLYSSAAGSVAGPSLLENALIRFAGRSGQPALSIASALVTARSVRAERNLGDGFLVGAHGGDALDWVAFANGSDGIELSGGSFDLLHATSAANGAVGIRSSAAHAGSVVSSIAWGNPGGNFTGYTAERMRSCDGSTAFAGADGNIDVDPLFVDPASGDLRLSPASPCVDHADATAALAVVKDHAEHSRLLDPTWSGTLLPDMGAYERYLWSMSVRGQPRVGRLLRLEVSGPAGSSLYLAGGLDGHFLVDPIGFVTCGTTSVAYLAVVDVGQPCWLPIPSDPSLAGTPFGIQTYTWPEGSTSVGAVTNLYRSKILPLSLDARLRPSEARPVLAPTPGE